MIKCYLSHYIRGPSGDKATPEEMRANCINASNAADDIRESINFSANIYVPGEHEFPPVGIFLQKGYLTIKQVLEVDCEILKQCDVILVYKDPTLSSGMMEELACAAENELEIFYFDKLDFGTLESLKMLLKTVDEDKNGMETV
jgi:hypothetical protein